MKRKLIILGMLLLICMENFVGCSGSEVSELSDYGEGTSKSKTAETNDEMSWNKTLELYQLLQENEAYPYVLSESAATFLGENAELFPAEMSAELDEYIDKSIEYKHLNKNIDKYGQTLFYNESMYVLDIHEENEKELYLTTLHVLDDDGNSFVIFYKGELPDVFKEDTVSVCGLPLGLSSFSNVGGGSTIAVILAGCNIEKPIDYGVYKESIGMYTHASEYALYDLDADGIKEIIISFGTCNADWANDIWTILDGEPYKLGTINGTRSFYENESGGVYAAYGHMDHEILDAVCKEGNELSTETLHDGMIDWGAGEDYFTNDKPLNWYPVSDTGILDN